MRVGTLGSTICALLRSPEIRSELLVRASGVGRTRIDWSVMRDIVVPKPAAAMAKELVRKMENAEEMIRKAVALQVEVRSQLESSFDLATDAAITTLQQFKPPK